MIDSTNKRMGAVTFVAYVAWFLLLVRLLYIATGLSSPNLTESLGTHLGLCAFLMVLLAIPYFIIRYRAKKLGEKTSWFMVMLWTSIITLVLTVGGLYGRLNAQSLAPQSVTAIPTYDTTGWTQENTGSIESGPWLKYSPTGTRYCRFADNTIIRLYPPNVKPNAEPANPFCLGDSYDRVPYPH